MGLDFFVPTAREVLDPRLARDGFAWAGSREGGVRWRCGGVELDVACLTETVPDYALLMTLRLGPGRRIAVWRLLPEHVDRLAMWSFTSEFSLHAELVRVHRDLLVPFVAPYWEDEQRLARVIGDSTLCACAFQSPARSSPPSRWPPAAAVRTSRARRRLPLP